VSGIITLIATILEKLNTYATGLHVELIENKIRLSFIQKGSSASLEVYDNTDYYNRFSSAINDSMALSSIIWSAVNCVSAIIAFFTTFLLLSNYNILFSLLITITSIPAAYARRCYTRELFKTSLNQTEDMRRSQYYFRLLTSKDHAPDIRVFNIAKLLSDKYNSLWNALFLARKKLITKRTVITGFLEFLPEVAAIIITFVISFNVLFQDNSIGDYSLYTSLLTQIWASILTLTFSFTQIYDYRLRIENIRRLDCYKSQVEDNGSRDLEQIDEIIFQEVTFCYPGTDNRVLDRLSLRIEKGENIAIVGKNGSGKSTLVKLVLRLYDPDDGKILINNVDIREYSIKSLRAAFSTYFQNNQNFAFSLKDNIVLGDQNKAKDVSDIYLRSVLRNAGAEQVLDKLNGDFNGYLSREYSQAGIELSDGENQRVALARTFFRNCQVVILDEPSSSLDAEAEYDLFCRLKQLAKHKTVITISHRLSNMREVNRILFLDAGGIIEDGNHELLMKKGGKYSYYYNLQTEKY